MPPRSKNNVNWFETWNRRSRLRSAKRMLDEAENSVDEPPLRAAEKAPQRKEKDLCGTAPPGFHNVKPKRNSNKVAESLHSSEATTPVAEDCDVNEEEQPAEAEADVDYKFFLDHLRFTGKSYVFEGVVDGSPLFLTYEEEDDSSEVIQSEPKTRNEETSGKGKVTRIRTACKGKRIREETRWKQSACRKKSRTESLSPSLSETFYSSPSDGENEEDYLQTDNDYMNFLNHVKDCNGSMILEWKNKVIRYEGEENCELDVHFDDVQHETTRVQAPVQQAVAQHRTRRKSVLVEDDREKALDEPVESSKEIVVKFEPVDYTDEVEVVQELPIQTVVCTEADNACSSALGLQPCMGDAGASTSVQEGDCLLKALTVKVSGPFRDRLEEILQKPFDEDEYEDLWNLATNRSSVVKYKHLRHDSVPYETNELSRSFLDHYADLKALIMKADAMEALKLLRGFFFWLENLSHEGAFRPWTLTLHVNSEPWLSDDLDSLVPLQVERPENLISSANLLPSNDSS